MRDTSYHCYQSKVSLLFQVGFDELETSSGGLAYRLDEEALADSELDARVIWTQLFKRTHQPEEHNVAYVHRENGRDLCTGTPSSTKSRCRLLCFSG